MRQDRYQRHSLIDWFPEDAIKKAKFAVVGCGAVGNEVSKNLALLGVGSVDLFDFDKIEIHNLTRSVLFREGDVGSSKVQVAAERLKDLDHNITVQVFDGDFWERMTLKMAADYDCVLCCVDNFEARLRINQLCRLVGTNLVNTGIDSKFAQVEVFPFGLNSKAACYECNLPESAYRRIQNRYSCGHLKKISYIERKIPTTIVTSSIVGSLAVSNAIRLLYDQSLVDARRVMVDTFSGGSTLSSIAKSSDCPCCSSLTKEILIIQGSPAIESELLSSLHGDECLVTSEPVLVSCRCVHCDLEGQEGSIIFKRASDFDASISVCKKCSRDSVDVVIKDVFSAAELMSDFRGRHMPVKFLRFDKSDLTVIIELELS